MTLNFTKKHRCFSAKDQIPIEISKVNYWVGDNGSGKSTALGCIAGLVKTKSHNWNAVDKDAKNVSFLFEVPQFSKIFVSSSKNRQAQMLDMDSLIDQGINRIWCSEGQNNLADLGEMKKIGLDENALLLIDEIDSHFSYKAKVYFFDYFLPLVKATCIVISHDSAFLHEKRVFDFTDRAYKTGQEFYIQQVQSLKAGFAKRK